MGSPHKGTYFAGPKITFVASEIEALVRHLSVSFCPRHDEHLVDFSRLSDSQKPMLYLSLVWAYQAVGRSALTGGDESLDPKKLPLRCLLWLLLRSRRTAVHLITWGDL
ncbi:MAG: putative ATP-dependent endonuclease of OLD family [Lentisphaeria bacterium]|jgi:putative ATP-dependent endonuclease of OLD family